MEDMMINDVILTFKLGESGHELCIEGSSARLGRHVERLEEIAERLLPEGEWLDGDLLQPGGHLDAADRPFTFGIDELLDGDEVDEREFSRALWVAWALSVTPAGL
jgi:hypothetical protein